MSKGFVGGGRVLMGLALAGCAWLGLVDSARADRIGIRIDQVVVQPIGNPVYQYRFDVETDPGFRFEITNFFVVYDLPLLLTEPGFYGPAYGQPSNDWVFRSELVTPLPSWYTSLPTYEPTYDDPTLPNVAWYYLGTTTLTGSIGPFFYTLDEPAPTGPLYEGAINFGDQPGNTFSSSGQMPGPGDSGYILVPEPAAVVLQGIGLATLGLIALRRRRRGRIRP